MEEVKVETPVEEKPVVETPKEVTPTEEKTLLGETKTPEEIAAAEKVAADEKVKADLLAKETPEEKTARETKEKADADALKVPEKYELKSPEGMDIDSKSIETLSPVFKELNLTNAQVQKLVDAYGPIVKAQSEATQKSAMDYWNKETEGWKTESLKILGSDAKKELSFAAKVIDKVGTTYKKDDGSVGNKLRDILDETRTGNHPEITKLFISLGKMISEDSFVDPTKNNSGGDIDLYTHPDSKANLK